MDDLTKLKEDLIRDAESQDEQRDAANEDMRFINAPGGMWEDFLTEIYSDRSKLQFDIISGPKNRFVGEWNQNRLGVEYKADDDATTDDDAELLAGIYRADFRDHSGKMAVDNAVDEMATCGFGAYGIHPMFEDDEDPENDNQRLHWHPKYNAYNSVFFDAASRRADKKDARWVTELTPFTRDVFEEKWPDATFASAYAPLDRKELDITKGSEEIAKVAARYEVVKKRVKVFVYANLRTGKPEVFEEPKHREKIAEIEADETLVFQRERTITKRRIEKTVFAGADILEKPRRVAGKWLPIVPVYGYRAYVDGKERYKGLVRDWKDAQRAFNVQMSQIVEDAASAEAPIPIFNRSQVQSSDVVNSWTQRDAAYRILDDMIDDNGNIVTPGPVGYTQPMTLDPNASLLLQVIPQYMQSQAGQIAESVDPDSSGKAIGKMLKRENLNTQILNDNISNAIALDGEIAQCMYEEILDTPRTLRTLSRDGTEGKDQLFKRVPDHEQGRVLEINKLQGKKFRAYPDVGPQYETAKEEMVEMLKGMADVFGDSEHAQQYLPAIVATIIQNTPGIGLGPLKTLARQQLMIMGLVEPESDEDKEFMEQAAQPKEDPQQELMQAAARQQNAEAVSLEASAVQKAADAELKRAKTAETMAGIDDQQVRTREDVRKSIFKDFQDISSQDQPLQ